ncbi:MAG TPA: thrombospondin type 3 repeat-containing protein [Polyangiaceae bacterium]|nr:thrombospondin type 3 repeat-containing protein [Polyangiaceae bacterium]
MTSKVASTGTEERDIALLDVFPPVIGVAFPQKPRLVVPPLSGGIGTFPFLIMGYGVDQTGSAPRFRQLQFTSGSPIKREHDVSSQNQHLWFHDYGTDPYSGPDSGDSGGPLLWRYDEHDPNKWDLLGDLTQRDTDDGATVWTDLTWDDGTRSWLEQAASVGAPTGKWRGETDYTGPCRRGDGDFKGDDLDCDGFLDRPGNDICPGIFNPEQRGARDADLDKDGVLDYCDNCPLDANYDQLDHDHDGYGDACDRCPGAPPPTADDSLCSTGCKGEGNRCVTTVNQIMLPADCFDPATGTDNCTVHRCGRPSDTDSDSVGDSCDNCAVANSDQANCNEESERARGLPPVGDACDNAPCSRSSSATAPLRALGNASCQLLGNCSVGVANRIDWQGVLDTSPPQEGTTTFAHCLCTGTHGRLEERLANCQTSPLGQPQCPAGQASIFPYLGTFSPSGWRAITTSNVRALPRAASGTPSRYVDLSDLLRPTAPQGVQPPPLGITGAGHPTGFGLTGAPSLNTQWLFYRDVNAFGVSYTPPSGGVTDYTELTTVANALRGVGWAQTTTLFGSTLDPNRANLSNHYFSQDLNPVPLGPLPSLGSLPIAVAPPGSYGCLTCGTSLPPWIARTDPGDLVAIGPGIRYALEPKFDNRFRDLIGSDLSRFFAPSESAEILKHVAVAERGAFIDRSTGLVTVVRAADDGFLRSTDVPGALPAAGVATFSGFHGEAYGLWSSDQVGRLTILDTRTSLRRELLIFEPAIQSPVAMTYRFEDDALYFLDRLSSSSVRVLRVDRNGAARVMGQLDSLGNRTQLDLSATTDGKLLLTASGQQSDVPLLITLAPDATSVKVVGYAFDSRAGQLALPPVASRADGLAIAKLSPGGLNLGAVDLSSFAKPTSASLADAGSLLRARSAIDDCGSAVLDASSSCAPLLAVAVYASRQLLLDDRVSLRNGTGFAAASSGGTQVTRVGSDTQVGSLLSKAAVDLRDRAHVNGFVTTGGTLTRGNATSISGASRSNAVVSPIKLDAFTAAFPEGTLPPVALEPDQQRSLSPGAYGTLSVKSRAKLSLSSGVYVFKSAMIEPDAQLNLNTSQGPIFIFVETSFTYRGKQNTPAGSAADVLVAVFGTSEVSIEATFTGTIVAPNAKLSLRSVAGGHRGSFFARDLEVFPDAVVTFAPFNYHWSP